LFKKLIGVFTNNIRKKMIGPRINPMICLYFSNPSIEEE